MSLKFFTSKTYVSSIAINPDQVIKVSERRDGSANIYLVGNIMVEVNEKYLDVIAALCEKE